MRRPYRVSENDRISINGWRVPPGFESDGCTCAPDRLFDVDLRAACIWHDWARRHLVRYGALTVQEADALFHRFLVGVFERADQLNLITRTIARLYWFGNKLLRGRFKTTQPIPDANWRSYLYADPCNQGIIVISEQLNA